MGHANGNRSNGLASVPVIGQGTELTLQPIAHGIITDIDHHMLVRTKRLKGGTKIAKTTAHPHFIIGVNRFCARIGPMGNRAHQLIDIDRANRNDRALRVGAQTGFEFQHGAHPLTLPLASPETRVFCIKNANTTGGTAAKIPAAEIRP